MVVPSMPGLTAGDAARELGSLVSLGMMGFGNGI